MKRIASLPALAALFVVGTTVGVVGLLPAAAFAVSSTSTSLASSSGSTSSGSATPGSSTPSSSSNQPSNPTCTPGVFAQAKQLVATELAGRVSQLDQLSTEIANTSDHLTSSDRQTLQNDVENFELPGIEALQPEVQTATTCAELRSDAHSMVFTYRVYMVMTPQTHLTIVADDETYIEGLLSNLESTISSALNDSNANSTNLSAAQNAFGQFQSEVSSAQSSIGGLSAQLLAQTPAEAPGNWEFFVQARTTLTAARNDLHSAYADALEIKTDLG